MLAIYGGKSVSYAPLCVRANCRLFRCLPRMKCGGRAAAPKALLTMPLLEVASSGSPWRGEESIYHEIMVGKAKIR
jgi:hypothetical protein